MIAPVAGPVSPPVHVRSVRPAVAPVAAVAAVAADGHPERGATERAAERAAVEAERAVSPPPEPVSTQSVLLLRQNGVSIAGIAEAYGMSVEAIRRLLHAGREEGAARAGDAG